MLNKILDFDGLKYPQGYGLALIKYAKQSILYSYVLLQTNQKMVGLSLNQQHLSDATNFWSAAFGLKL